MRYDAERVNDTAGEPSLADMVEKAIHMLQKNNNGYFLFVEGKGLGLDDEVTRQGVAVSCG